MKISVTLNDKKIILEAEPSEKLMTVLRREKLYSVKCGCGKGFCGSCTVLLDNRAVPSCIIPIGMIRNCSIITLEYFQTQPIYSDIIKGFSQAGIQLCGYCNAGKIFTAYEVLSNYYRPDRKQLYDSINKFDTCCIDRDTLANGILYAVAAKHSREGKHINGKK
ncbi:MAG: 2Fe-2S iron-sulfur cluster-binding protein [Treponema sp.]